MTALALITVDDEHGSAHRRVEPVDLTDQQWTELHALVDRTLAQLVAAGLPERDASIVLAGTVVRLLADADAYDRECARRGLLL